MSLHSDITDACQQHGISMNTDAGQHFLIEQTVLDSVLKAADLQGDEHVLEIGAGLGVLTRELVKHAGRVTTIEWDRRWIGPLTDFVRADTLPDGKLTIINANALKVPLPEGPYRVVANIPYNITAPLLQELFLQSGHPPDRAVLLIQREVADKLKVDPPETYLGLLVALAGKTTMIRKVPAGAFLPPPKVESAVIRIDTHNPPLADAPTIRTALEFASVAFRGKRKMLRTTVGKFRDGAERLEAAGIAADRRPETLTAAEWLAIARAKA